MTLRILCILWMMIIFHAAMPTFAAQTSIPTAEDSLTARIDQLFATWDKPDSPGAAIAIIKDGVVVYQSSYGSANLEYDIPISPSSVFNIASVSKQFTAFAILKLANEGKLSLDDDIRKYLDEVPDFGQKITIRHLIHHTSGLRGIWPLFHLIGLRLNDDVTTTDDVLTLVKNQRELNFKPADRYMYCNTGYTLLAVIVQRVSGMSFREYTTEHIFKPLGMINSHFHDDREMIIKNRTYAYRPANGFYKKVISNNEVVGNGHLYTTAEDLAKWVGNFRSGIVGGPGIFKQMQERGILNNGERITYAFGLVVDIDRGLGRIGHSGAHGGYRSNLSYFPEQGLGIIVLSNFAAFSPSALTNQVAEIFLAEHFDKSSPQGQTAISAKDYDTAEKLGKKHHQFIGHYTIQEGTSVRQIHLQDDRIFYHRSVGNESQLAPLKDGRLLMLGPSDEWILSVRPTKPGSPKQLQWFRNGIFHSYLDAYEPWSPQPKALKKFEGSYYSPEIRTYFTVKYNKEKLTIQRSRHKDLELEPRMKDTFYNPFGLISFRRDDQDRITSFHISAGNVRNLLFERQSQK